jgi:hypothetical protein
MWTNENRDGFNRWSQIQGLGACPGNVFGFS